MAALARLAAADGGDEQDAVLLLLHLLSPGVDAMALAYRGTDPDVLSLIVAELAVQIRAFPWRRRHRAIAANLLLDTRMAIRRELFPRAADGSHAGEDILIDPTAPLLSVLDRQSSDQRPGEAAPLELDVDHMLAWAARGGLARHDDLFLLRELHRYAALHKAPRLVLAAEYGINERTVRRRRDRALRALREARRQYLGAA
jgi:hypothetical protein